MKKKCCGSRNSTLISGICFSHLRCEVTFNGVPSTLPRRFGRGARETGCIWLWMHCLTAGSCEHGNPCETAVLLRGDQHRMGMFAVRSHVMHRSLSMGPQEPAAGVVHPGNISGQRSRVPPCLHEGQYILIYVFQYWYNYVNLCYSS